MSQYQSFSKNILYQNQQNHYEKEGVNVWNNNELPYYITNNPYIGAFYAQFVISLLEEQKTDAPLYILELGAGHGKFAFHFLRKISRYLEHTHYKIKYIISDFTLSTINFCRENERLIEFIENDILDFALFDANKLNAIELLESKEVLKPALLENPLVVFGNYFFDNIPQDLFHFQKGKIYEVLSKTNSVNLHNVGETIEKEYIERKDLILNEVLNLYKDEIEDSYAFIPELSIQCLEYLKSLSKNGMILLFSDKGYHHQAFLTQNILPEIVKHGEHCFSVDVNFNAIKKYSALKKYKFVFPDQITFQLLMGGVFWTNNDYPISLLKLNDLCMDSHLDQYHSQVEIWSQNMNSFSIIAIIGIIRHSQYDTTIFDILYDKIYSFESVTNKERIIIKELLVRLWDNYYPLDTGEKFINNIAKLYFKLAFFSEALSFFELNELKNGATKENLNFQKLCLNALDLIDEKEEIQLRITQLD